MDHEQLKAELAAQIDGLRGHVDSKFQVIERVLAGLGKRMEEFETDARARKTALDVHEIKIAEHHYRLTKLEQLEATLNAMRNEMRVGFEALVNFLKKP